MSKKTKSVFVCQSCGTASPQWLGRCPGCGSWNTLVEERDVSTAKSAKTRPSPQAAPTPLGQIEPERYPRLCTGGKELDRVLGGGLVPGSVLILGGEPGIGKSTLLLQVLAQLSSGGTKTLYVSGEESLSQIALRAERLADGGMKDVVALATAELDEALKAIETVQPQVVVIDSIQTIRSADLSSAAGSVGQLREVTARLLDEAKRQAIVLILVGHVTKEGNLAGPKVLEHLVDAVFSFEGDRTYAYRMVRGAKNRFGPTHEVAVYEMQGTGLVEVADPSALFLAERPLNAPGSLVVPTADGTRSVLVEIQALVAPAAYGNARRLATGLDLPRLSVLLAVLQRRAGVHVLDQDVFASVAGGLHVDERGVDLAVAIAVASSLRERPVPSNMVAFGEIGLAGEVRAVPRPEIRVVEAKKMGFTRIILPRGNVQPLTQDPVEGVELIAVSSLSEALSAALDRR